jgi:lysophospholipase L1-like esterase
MSNLTVALANDQFDEVVLQHQPDMAVLQCGVIEGCPRILPRRARTVLETMSWGRTLTRFLYGHRRAWIHLLATLGVCYCDVPPQEFSRHIRGLSSRCKGAGIRLVLVRVPTLSDEFDRKSVPGAIAALSAYDAILLDVARELEIPVVDPLLGAGDPTRDTLYLPGTVHFSVTGHTLVAENIVRFLARSGFAAQGREAMRPGETGSLPRSVEQERL